MHDGVLAVLGLREPRLNLAPAPPVMEVQVVPYYVLSTPRAPEAERLPPLAERPIRPRRTLRPDETSPVAPLVTPRAPPAARGPWTLEPAAPGAPAPPADLRQALRRGAAGCANPEEKEYCMSRLLPKMLVGGFTTVTIGSVILAGYLGQIIETVGK